MTFCAFLSSSLAKAAGAALASLHVSLPLDQESETFLPQILPLLARRLAFRILCMVGSALGKAPETAVS